MELVTYRQLLGRSYERLTRGAYAVAGSPRTHREHIQAMRAVLPPEAVLGGLSAAWALGVNSARAETEVEVVLPPAQRVRSRPGLKVRGDVLLPGETMHTALGIATTGARTAFDLGRAPCVPAGLARTPLRQLTSGRVVLRSPDATSAELCRAVGLVDAVLRATGDPIRVVEQLAQQHPGVRGAQVLRIVLALADPRAEAIPESVLRTHIVLGGLPRPVPQYVVLGPDGAFVARADLAWPELKLAAEYDGLHHNEPRQFSADRDRDTRLHLAGWRPIHLDAMHLRDPAGLLDPFCQAVLL